MEVTLEMIEMLEMCIIFYAVGNITFQYQLFHVISYPGIVQLVLGIIYMVLPLQEINEYLFSIDNEDENEKYDVAKFQFNTDYDRENPVLKTAALKEWNKEFFQRNKERLTTVINQHQVDPTHHQFSSALLNITDNFVHNQGNK